MHSMAFDFFLFSINRGNSALSVQLESSSDIHIVDRIHNVSGISQEAFHSTDNNYHRIVINQIQCQLKKNNPGTPPILLPETPQIRYPAMNCCSGSETANSLEKILCWWT